MADDSGEDEVVSLEEKLLRKHRQERKQLQAEIQKLKHGVPKGDKKKKKDVAATTAQMEAEMDARHDTELQQLQSQQEQVNDLTDATSALDTNESASTNQQKEPKISKAQKKRDRKAQKQQQREEEIRQQAVENLLGDRHIETQKIKALLRERDLAIFEIPSDGNCLYAAIQHQMQSRDIEQSVTGLRKQTADHMRSDPDTFLPFLCHQDTGDLYTSEEFEKYCDKLETTPEWGGQLELQALANVLRIPIEVLQANTPAIQIGEEYKENPIILTYHHHYYGLGEHYNSVIPRSQVADDDEDEEGFS